MRLTFTDAHALRGGKLSYLAAAEAPSRLRDRHLGLPQRALLVLDTDDPDRSSELCEVALSGPWWD